MSLKFLAKYPPMVYLFYILSFFVVLGLPLFSFINQNNNKICDFKINLHDYICFEKEVDKRLRTGSGVEAAIGYVNDHIVEKNGSYVTAHMLFHYIGDYAYVETKSLDKSLNYIFPYIKNKQDGIFYDGFDGFFHGVISEFFVDNLAGGNDPKDLVSGLCTRNFAFSSHSWRIPFCYHISGHGVMAANGNDVYKSLQICSRVSYKYKYDDCSHGVFMENAFLYLPYYHLGLPRPNVQGVSMLDMCNGLKGEKSLACSYFIGQSMLSNNPDDLSDALGECAKVINDDGVRSKYRACIKQVGYYYIPAKYRGDFNSMIKLCKTLGDGYIGDCLSGTSNGIRFGAAGKKYKQFDFCALLDKKLRHECYLQ